jgi:hypothetical protein
MRTPFDLYARAGRLSRAMRVLFFPALALALALSLAGPAVAAPGTSPLGASARRDLRQTLLERYQVSGVHNGVLLKPRLERIQRLGVREIEITGDAVAVNGAHVSPEVLRSWIGETEAPTLLRLLDLSPVDRQTLFDLKHDVTAAPTPGGTGGGPGAPPPAANDRAAAAGAGAAAEVGDEEDRGRASVPSTPPTSTAPVPPEAAQPPEPSPPTPPIPPTPPTSPVVNAGSRVRFAGPVTVEKNEVAEDVVAIGGSVHVEGEVNRDVTAVGGSVRINGRVGGDVTAVGGTVHLGPRAEVMGDVAAIGGTVIRDSGAVVHGSLSDVGSVWPGLWHGRDDDWDNRWVLLAPIGHSLRLFWSMAFLVMLMLAVSLVVLLAPRALEQVRGRIADEPWTALAAGIATEVLTAPALGALVVLLLITIVGCVFVLLVPFLILALMIAALVGFAGVAYQLGRVLEGRFSARFGGPYLTTMIGVLAIESFSLVGHVLALGGGVLHFFALMFGLFGLLLRYVAWTIGFGAAILTAFANRPQRFRRSVPPGAPTGTLPPPAPPGTAQPAPGGLS